MLPNQGTQEGARAQTDNGDESGKERHHQFLRVGQAAVEKSIIDAGVEIGQG